MRLLRIALAGAGVAALGAGGYWALRLGYANWLAGKGEAGAVARAVELAPSNASFRARLAAVKEPSGEDPGAAIPALEAAVALKPGYASAWIELGLRREARGEVEKAEKCLREAARVDRTFEPRWALANFYFRRAEAEKFWEWARRAGEMVYGDARPLFRLCWEMTPDARLILDRVVPNRAATLGQYLGFLVSENHLAGAEAVAERLTETGDREQAGVLLDYCSRQVDTGQVESAVRAWNRMAERGLIESERLAPEDGASLTNGGFRRNPVGRGFDWRMPGVAGVTVTRGEQERAVRVAFSGEQPEQCECLWQWAPVLPGRRYRLRFEYQTEEVGAPSGLQWRVMEGGSLSELAPGTPDLAAGGWTRGEMAFQTRAGTRLVRLALGYRRASGTPRIQGALWVRGLRLDLER
jgi:tetratricopeptide (TPR) repeat protein